MSNLSNDHDFKPAFERLCVLMDHDNFKANDNPGLIQSNYMSAWAAAMSDINQEQYLSE